MISCLDKLETELTQDRANLLVMEKVYGRPPILIQKHSQDEARVGLRSRKVSKRSGQLET